MPLYEYRCPECDNVMTQIFSYEERPNTVECDTPKCTGTAQYFFGKPAMLKIKFDQNGRVGYKTDYGTGKKRFSSATREKYEHTIGNKPLKDVQGSGGEKAQSVYTKEYSRHLKDKETTQKEIAKKVAKEKR